MKRLYLDWNATAPVLPQVRDAVMKALEAVPGNASSVHREGQSARAVVERTRRSVAKAVGAPAQAVVFTGGATESNNQVLRHHVRTNAKPFVVCTAVEHPSVLEVVEDLAKEGVKTAVWPVDRKGRLDMEWLEKRLDEGVTLVSAMWANNETGTIFDVASIVDAVHEAGALLHVDATQAVGRMEFDFQACGADYMTLSFHKMGGPKGVGATVVREGLKVGAIMSGGHQERGRRPGTENVPALAGLDAAAKAVVDHGEMWIEALKRRKAAFLEELTRIEGVEFRGDQAQQLPNTVNAAFDGVDGEDLLMALDLEGVSASSGSACTAGSLEPSHVILAMGYEEKRARESVRFSFGPSTPVEELARGAQKIAQVVKRLRRIDADWR